MAIRYTRWNSPGENPHQKWECKDEQELRAEMTEYLRRYPTPGYGTTFRSVQYDNNTGDYWTVMHRLSSCD